VRFIRKGAIALAAAAAMVALGIVGASILNEEPATITAKKESADWGRVMQAYQRQPKSEFVEGCDRDLRLHGTITDEQREKLEALPSLHARPASAIIWEAP